MDNPFKSPSVLSFCPGILGIERGLKDIGTNCRVAAYVEIEAYIIANLVAGMESGLVDPAPIWTDAKTFDASPFRGKIHSIIGGSPVLTGKDEVQAWGVPSGISSTDGIGSMAYADNSGSGQDFQQGELWPGSPQQSSQHCGTSQQAQNGQGGPHRWPAGPKQPQFPWEDPRTIKSGLGCTINGYNFREDLLRSLGNSVVQQTASLGFLDLLRKHLQNFRTSYPQSYKQIE